MRPSRRSDPESRYSRRPTASHVLGWYLLAAAGVVALVVASDPVSAAVVAVAGAGGLVALAGLVRTARALRRGERRRVPLPGTRACVEIRPRRVPRDD